MARPGPAQLGVGDEERLQAGDLRLAHTIGTTQCQEPGAEQLGFEGGADRSVQSPVQGETG